MTKPCQYCDYIPDPNLCNPADACESCRELAEVEEQIRKTLIHLAKERQRLKEKINHTHDRMIHRLPVEVASIIFEFCVTGCRNGVIGADLSRSSRYTISAPFILSAVCRQWRMIVHSTPQLWNTLLLYARPNYLLPPNLVEHSIDHSGDLPLSINIYFPSYFAQNSVDHIIDVLNRYTHRWSQMKYIGPSDTFMKLASSNQDLPQLHTLYINPLNDTSHDPSRSEAIKLNSKRLSCLKLFYAVRLGVQDLGLNLQYLKKVELLYTTLYECLDVLRKAPGLRECTFMAENLRDVVRSSDALPLPRNIVIQPEMYSLDISGSILHSSILKELTCPSLTTLTLRFRGEKVDMPLILKFLVASGCCLERLSLIYAELSTQDVTALCKTLPTSLQYLHIYHHRSLPSIRALFEYLGEFTLVNGVQLPRYLLTLRSLFIEEDSSQKDWSHWLLLPKIFGTPAIDSYATQRHRHQLKSVVISVKYRWSRPAVPRYIEAESEAMKRILWLYHQEGVNFGLGMRLPKYDRNGNIIEEVDEDFS
ncbi:hypothetical protein BDN70DRAFT_884122 [Pholiota conissans]|uniref:F-box domain-containing protein n=1 Tax=Pholiota conissans TaxID=109636 RepID=A0A9P5YWD7_9AGAR|nr:hypothetical protein BDN70DRAFT_884122 [Pholiota conissans]